MPDKLKARLPRGLTDRGPAEIAATRRMIETIRAVYERYGFEPGSYPVTEAVSQSTLALPFHANLDEGTIDQVCEALQAAF